MRHADTGDDAGGADGAGADADFDHVCTRISQSNGGVGGGDIAADDDEVGMLAAQLAHAVKHAFGVAMRGIDDDDVHPGGGQEFDAPFAVATGADGGADAQAFVLVFAGERIVARAAQVFDGNESFQGEAIINQQHFFDAVFVQ